MLDHIYIYIYLVVKTTEHYNYYNILHPPIRFLLARYNQLVPELPVISVIASG